VRSKKKAAHRVEATDGERGSEHGPGNAAELRVLFVEDQQADIDLALAELRRDGLKIASVAASSEAELRRQLCTFEPDIVLCDYNMPGFSGPHAMEIVRRLRPSTPILMITGSISEDVAVECLKLGATDYLLKSSLRRLAPAVRRAVGEHRERLALESRIERLAHYDTLTGLPNLTQLGRLVTRAIERSASGRRFAVVSLNLDRFRFASEVVGRNGADLILKQTAELLQAECRDRDAIARVASDEFLLVLTDIDDVFEVGVLVHGLLAAVAKPRRVSGREIQVTASAGIALFPDDGATFEALIGSADAAMHESKAGGPGRFQFHSSDRVRHAQERRRLEADLRTAIRREEMSLHFQPQFDIRTGQVCGVEALTRWYREDGSTVSPATFIPLAEQSGLIDALGEWALHAGCGAAVLWKGSGGATPTLSVNVSSQQISDRFTAVIADAMRLSGLPAERLELEITESVLISNPTQVLDCLAAWKRLGVRVAVDDFGTGYSSLSYLSRLPVDRLKIDKSLVHGMMVEPKDSAIVRAVISLGRELGFTVIAEGVETEAQLAALDALGCEQAQGFLLAAPAAASDAEALMTRRWGARHLPVEHPLSKSTSRGSNVHVQH
jgi:diguanylate cyclase (GGDEF)-like protein